MAWVTRIFGVLPGERRRTLLMATSILTIVASYMMVKAVRDAVFLAKFDLTMRALVQIGVALCAGLGAALFTRLGHGRSRVGVIVRTNVVVACSLVGLRIALAAHVPGMATVLFVWSSFFGLVVIANFWLLANELYDARSAKRLFAILGAGAIVGGVVGGEVTRQLAHAIGAVNLLLVIAGGILLSALLAGLAARGCDRAVGKRAAQTAPPRISEGFHLVREHLHLRSIASLLLLSTLATTLIDWQVQSMAKEHFASNANAMTAFFGRLTALLSLASLLVQLFVTSRFLRRFGVGAALFVLPATILLGAGAIGLHVTLALSALGAATVAKVGDGGVRFSLDKAAMELLYLPVPERLKGKAKPVIDTFVDRLGGALTGVAWIAITGLSTLLAVEDLAVASLVTAGIVAAWAAAIGFARRHYVQSLRDALPAPLARRTAFRAGETIEAGDLDEQVRVYRLHMRALEEAQGETSAGARLLRRMLHVAIGRDLEHMFATLASDYPEADVAYAYRGMQCEDPAIRAHAIELLDNLLDRRLRRVVVPALDELQDPRERDGLELRTLRALAAGADPWLRACALYVIGERTGAPIDLSEDRELEGIVRDALHDADPRVREAAASLAAGSVILFDRGVSHSSPPN